MKPLKIGSHVGMSGKEMLLGSVKEAVSYGANTFMFYTGAPQNTRRKELSELNIEPAWEYMKEHGIDAVSYTHLGDRTCEIIHIPFKSVIRYQLSANPKQPLPESHDPGNGCLFCISQSLLYFKYSSVRYIFFCTLSM